MKTGVEAILARVCGLDVHRDSVMACVRIVQPDGGVHRQAKRFGTMTGDLEMLREWLKAAGVTHVAMESTGVFWQPVYNLLEEHFIVWLVNAQHIKQVPGRKTDMKDSEWIAQLLQCGLLRPSLMLERTQRELRELTRHRTRLVEQRNAVANRIQKVLQGANLKLSSVASDVLGASGRAMLEAIIAGEDDPVVLANLAQRRMRAKIPQLERALRGRVTEHQRFMLRELLEQVDFLEGRIEATSRRIERIAPLPFAEATRLLDAVPGVGERGAQAVLAEIGTDMSHFPTASHLASWAAQCPGNHESAGKHFSGRTRRGNRWLGSALTQLAHAAARTKGSYFHAQYHRIAPRRGKNRAIGAVKHSLLVTFYYMLRRGETYRDLGPNHFPTINSEQQIRYHLRRLERLGQKVQLTPMETAA